MTTALSESDRRSRGDNAMVPPARKCGFCHRRQPLPAVSSSGLSKKLWASKGRYLEYLLLTFMRPENIDPYIAQIMVDQEWNGLYRDGASR